MSSLEKDNEELLPLREKVSSLESQLTELAVLKEAVESLNDEKKSLEEQLEVLQSRTSEVKSQSSPSKSVAVIQEERLKWQVETANIRRELEGKLVKGTKEWEEERRGLKQEVAKLREELSSSGSLANQLQLVQAKFDQSCHR